MTLADRRIGFIGGGAMAEALAGGLIAAGVPCERVVVAEPEAARREHLAGELGVTVLPDNAGAVSGSDVVVLAVKPDVVEPALAALGAAGSVDLGQPLWISIAAGLTLARLEAALPAGARIVRAMPNTPALVRAGATALCGNAQVGEADLTAARTLFDGVGITWEAPEEALLDAVTGLSGSGPAYLFLFLEALVDAGENAGLPAEASLRLACQTVFGAAKLALETGRPPAELRAQVSSPGGTTVAGIEQLETGGLRAAIHKAVAAATRRSRELGGG